jgi:hypothetical protein
LTISRILAWNPLRRRRRDRRCSNGKRRIADKQWTFHSRWRRRRIATSGDRRSHQLLMRMDSIARRRRRNETGMGTDHMDSMSRLRRDNRPRPDRNLGFRYLRQLVMN